MAAPQMFHEHLDELWEAMKAASEIVGSVIISISDVPVAQIGIEVGVGPEVRRVLGLVIEEARAESSDLGDIDAEMRALQPKDTPNLDEP